VEISLEQILSTIRFYFLKVLTGALLLPLGEEKELLLPEDEG
jgi:hypothetical protein